MLKKICLLLIAWCLMLPAINFSMHEVEESELTDVSSDQPKENKQTSQKSLWQRFKNTFSSDKERSSTDDASATDSDESDDEELNLALTRRVLERQPTTREILQPDVKKTVPTRIPSQDEIRRSNIPAIPKRTINTRSIEQETVLTLLAPIARTLPDDSSYANTIINLGNRIKSLSPYDSPQVFQAAYTDLIKELESLRTYTQSFTVGAQKIMALGQINEALTLLGRITNRLKITS